MSVREATTACRLLCAHQIFAMRESLEITRRSPPGPVCHFTSTIGMPYMWSCARAAAQLSRTLLNLFADT